MLPSPKLFHISNIPPSKPFGSDDTEATYQGYAEWPDLQLIALEKGGTTETLPDLRYNEKGTNFLYRE